MFTHHSIKKKTTTSDARIINLPASDITLSFIKLKTSAGHILIKPEEIMYLSAEDNYCRVTTIDGHNYLQASTLSGLLRRLGTQKFIQLHQSHVVNAEHIKALSFVNNQMICLLSNGHEVPVSRRKYKSLPIHII